MAVFLRSPSSPVTLLLVKNKKNEYQNGIVLFMVPVTGLEPVRSQ